MRCVCWICHKVALPTLKAVVRHMASVHAHDPLFRVCCGIDGCSWSYTNFYSFKKHLYRKHREAMEVDGTYGNRTEDTDADDSSQLQEYEDHESEGTLFQEIKSRLLSFS